MTSFYMIWIHEYAVQKSIVKKANKSTLSIKMLLIYDMRKFWERKDWWKNSPRPFYSIFVCLFSLYNCPFHIPYFLTIKITLCTQARSTLQYFTVVKLSFTLAKISCQLKFMRFITFVQACMEKRKIICFWIGCQSSCDRCLGWCLSRLINPLSLTISYVHYSSQSCALGQVITIPDRKNEPSLVKNLLLWH